MAIVCLRIPALRSAYSTYTGKELADVFTLEKFLSPLPTPWAGCKILHEHLFWHISNNRDFFARYHDAHIIFLSRRNKIASAISLLQARRSWRWNTDNPSDRPVPMRVSLRKLLAIIKKTEALCMRSRLKIAETGMSCLEISYEDMFADPQKTLSSIADFLSVPHTFTFSKLKKQARIPADEYVTNWADIIKNLERNEEFSPMLEEMRMPTANIMNA